MTNRRSASRLAAPTFAVGVALLALGACDSGRGTALRPYPGAPTGSTEFVPGTVAAADIGYVDALATNFVDGGRLVARVDEPAARCVAERWVAIMTPAALGAGGIAAGDMDDVTLDRLKQTGTLDAVEAQALTASFAACGVDHTAAFLDSLLLTSQITPTQRVCLAGVIAPGLVSSITVSVLVEPTVAAALATQYQQALDACPG